MFGFTVRLWRVSSEPVTASFAADDATVEVGPDDIGAFGAPPFIPGVTEETVVVGTYEDAQDEGVETGTRRHADASGVRIAADTVGGGTAHSDALQQEEPARFRRRVAGRMVRTLAARTAMTTDAHSYAVLAGQLFDFPGLPPSRDASARAHGRTGAHGPWGGVRPPDFPRHASASSPRAITGVDPVSGQGVG